MIEMLLAALCAACSWIAFHIVAHRDPVVVTRVADLGDVVTAPEKPRRKPIVELFGRVGRRFPGKSEVADGHTLRGAQICVAAMGFVVGLAAGPLAVLISPALAAVGFRIPKIVVRKRAARRQEQVAVALPDAIDLLAVCTHAGLNLSLSLQRVASRTRGVLGEELNRTLAEIELGVPRPVALRALAERNPNGDLEALVGVLENAERFGTQVASSLETFAGEVRGRRRRSAEEQARKAPVKILFPLIFLILPAFGLLSVVPLLLGAFSALKF